MVVKSSLMISFEVLDFVFEGNRLIFVTFEYVFVLAVDMAEVIVFIGNFGFSIDPSYPNTLKLIDYD